MMSVFWCLKQLGLSMAAYIRKNHPGFHKRGILFLLSHVEQLHNFFRVYDSTRCLLYHFNNLTMGIWLWLLELQPWYLTSGKDVYINYIRLLLKASSYKPYAKTPSHISMNSFHLPSKEIWNVGWAEYISKNWSSIAQREEENWYW
jgi:hypothetical protein